MRPCFEWTDEAVAKLKELWAQGHSASKIAPMIGPGLSRSSIIGKVHRLKLEGRKTVIREPVSNGKERKFRNPHISLAKRKFRIFEDEDQEDRMDNTISFFELRHNSCRFPIGDPSTPDFGFCGEKRFEDYPYCARHCCRAYEQKGARNLITMKVAA